MSPSSAAPSAPITDFATELDALVADAMSEWKIPGLEFRRGADRTVNEMIFHQPNGIFPAQRA